MKRNKVLFLVLFGGVALINSLQAIENIYADCRGADCGKVIGWVIDPETKLPIENEKFDVLFLDCREYRQLEIIGPKFKKFKIAEVDKRGHFSMKLKEGEYCVRVVPGDYSGYERYKSKYALDPYPGCTDKKLRIRVKRGQITVIKRVLSYGGSISLEYVNQDGDKIDFIERYSCEEVPSVLILFYSKPYCSYKVCAIPENSSGYYEKRTARNLYPGKYKAIIEFYTGNTCRDDFVFGPVAIREIDVKAKKDTKIRVVLDETTGLIVKVYNKNKKPLKNIEVEVKDNYAIAKSINIIYEFYNTICITNDKGVCKILNLNSRINYEVSVYNSKTGEEKIIKNFKIPKGKIRVLKVYLEGRKKGE